jgi:hypothetical protein
MNKLLTSLIFIGFNLFRSQLLFAQELHLEPLQGEMEFPGFRYSRENQQIPVPSYWPDSVTVQFQALVDEEVQKRALTDLLQYAQAAMVDLKIVGFPNELFSERERLTPEANIAVLEVDDANYQAFRDGSVVTKTDLFADNPILSGIASKGLVEQFDGCLARWNADENNRISGFVVALRAGANVQSKEACIASVSPAAFGLFPRVNLLDVIGKLSTEPAVKNAPPFTFESERVLALNAAAYCRNYANRIDASCPYVLIKAVMAFHHDLTQRF